MIFPPNYANMLLLVINIDTNRVPMDQQKNTATLSKSESWQMFNDISPRYDLLNHLLSFGLHTRWRRQLAKFLSTKADQKVLDLATGTADVLLSLFKNSDRVRSGCGIDLADKMMDIGRKKIARQGLEPRITLHHGDAHQIPFNEHTFDAATIAFGIRNMDDPKQVLREMKRILNTGGRVIILEFSLPRNTFIRHIHLFYLRHVVPLIGALFSGHYQAYRYLNQTIETFPYGDDFCSLMIEAGFQNVETHPLLFGVASIYCGDKV